MKTFALQTYGCKVNQYESQSLRQQLLGLGFQESDRAVADIYVVNTCAVTQKAQRKSKQAIRKFNYLNPQAKIFVTGCSAQNQPDELKSLLGVTCVLGNSRKANLPESILKETAGANIDASTSLSTDGERSPELAEGRSRSISRFHKHTRAFLKIQDGCNNGCSYCIIPKLRGPSCSRPLSEIIQEAKSLVDNGYQELVLCGICLGAYAADLGLSHGLIRLIEELEKIEGLFRIRLSSIEASDLSPELINTMLYSKKICRHLHIPFQSGDDKILRLMNRKMLSWGYRALVQRLRESLPSIGITTDIMVGFPGEDKENFGNTLNFLKEVKPSRIHVFSFSPRKNTPVFHMLSEGVNASTSLMVNPRILKERQGQIKALAKELALDFCRAQINKPLDVLVEDNPSLSDEFYRGYSSNYIRVYLSKIEATVNTIVRLNPIKLYRDGLFAASEHQKTVVPRSLCSL